MTTATHTKDVPAEALQLNIGQLQFMDSGDSDSTENGMFPFRMFARSAEPIDHWYWGRIVHDMSGMQLRKDSCPIDYRHSEYEIIGYGDTFDANDDGLTIAGFLVSLDDKDRAFEVAHKGSKGVPYEASIDWRGPGIRIEELGEGASTEVNGQTFEGPGVVVREWPLRAAAVTPYGADSNTSTQFSEQSGDDTDTVSVCLFSASGESPVSKTTDAKKPANDDTQQHAATPAPESSAAPATGTPAAQITVDTLNQFSEAFGDKALEYLQAGLTFDAATVAHKDHQIAELTDRNKQLSEQLKKAGTDESSAAETLKQLGDQQLGEETPVETPAGKGTKTQFADFFTVK